MIDLNEYAYLAAASVDELANVIIREHSTYEFVGGKRQVMPHYRVAGLALLEARSKFSRGYWSDWVKENLPFSMRTAQCYMQIAKQWDVAAPDAEWKQSDTLSGALRLMTNGRPAPSTETIIAGIMATHGTSRQFATELAGTSICMACGKRPATVTDHDHQTGRLRGRVCRSCNAVLTEDFSVDECRRRAAYWKSLADYLERNVTSTKLEDGDS